MTKKHAHSTHLGLLAHAKVHSSDLCGNIRDLHQDLGVRMELRCGAKPSLDSIRYNVLSTEGKRCLVLDALFHDWLDSERLSLLEGG